MNLAYEIRRSPRRRKITITVERDSSIVVLAPQEATEERIDEVVNSKRQWIYEKKNHSQKYQELPHPPGKELINGETTLYLGREYRIQLVKAEGREIVFEDFFYVPEVSNHSRESLFTDWYIQKAKEIVLPRVERYAKELGVAFNSAKIIDTRYRWGSCTPSSNINLSWRLIKAPMFVIDYVIIHELAHLMESNHTEKFWNIVKTHVPAMEKAKSWLRLNGQVLENEI